MMVQLTQCVMKMRRRLVRPDEERPLLGLSHKARQPKQATATRLPGSGHTRWVHASKATPLTGGRQERKVPAGGHRQTGAQLLQQKQRCAGATSRPAWPPTQCEAAPSTDAQDVGTVSCAQPARICGAVPHVPRPPTLTLACRPPGAQAAAAPCTRQERSRGRRPMRGAAHAGAHPKQRQSGLNRDLSHSLLLCLLRALIQPAQAAAEPRLALLQLLSLLLLLLLAAREEAALRVIAIAHLVIAAVLAARVLGVSVPPRQQRLGCRILAHIVFIQRGRGRRGRGMAG